MRKIFLALAVLVSPSAYATYEYIGTIQSIYMGPGDAVVFVQIPAAPSGVVACDTNATYDFVFDAGTVAGKNTLAALLTAYATQQTVRLTSSDSCSVFGGVPNLGSVTLK